jgi:hypothetical protein
MEHAASQRSSMFALLVLAVKGGLCWVSQMYVRAQTDGCLFCMIAHPKRRISSRLVDSSVPTVIRDYESSFSRSRNDGHLLK